MLTLGERFEMAISRQTLLAVFFIFYDIAMKNVSDNFYCTSKSKPWINFKTHPIIIIIIIILMNQRLF